MKRSKRRTAKFQGLDLSPNHAAFIEINEYGEKLYAAAVIDNETAASAAASMGVDVTYFPAEKLRDKHDRDVWLIGRLATMNAWLARMLDRSADMLAIENYAYSKSHHAYEIGEIGGCARVLASYRGKPFRLINPRSVKTYAGIKSKEKPIAFCAANYGVDWSEANGGIKSPAASGDLSDAHVLAFMGRDCWMLECGHVSKLDVRKPIADIVKKSSALVGSAENWRIR